MPAPLLELKHITKRFPGVLALDDVSLSVGTGEVVALIGENGAGKSTLMNILGGVHQADTGEIWVDGRRVTIRTVADAIALGIGFIHQELNVIDNLSVAGNVYVGREPTWCGPLRLIDRRRIARGCELYLKRLGLNVSPHTLLGDLSLAQQQMVEIAKALSQNARLLIMDEPTSSLTLSETERLLAAVRDLSEHGVSIIYISHRLGEVGVCADRVVALRDGRNAGELPRGEISHQKMVSLMIGRKLEDLYVHGRGAQQPRYFEVEGLRTRYRPRHKISFDVARGEILGFAGLVGAGRSEMAQAIFGVDPPLEGRVRLDGRELTIHNARDAIKAGIFLAPEDRRRMGLILEMVVRENVTMAGLKQCSRWSLIRFDREVEVARRQVEALRVKTPSIETKAMNLSGGTQQKVVLAKWLSLEPKVIIFDEPTRGIDVGAKAEIYRLMRDLADRGVAIIMISSEMEEVIGVSDRIAAMHEGDIAGFLAREQFSEEAIMNLVVGGEPA
ncbi:MAG TPA: sugar ABC transporter ATP-binding protein [Verrucomicrobiae bacterium]|nr:sugar ABC transporter ATP-binding protein [Verrucomicrobiae bacterium]